MTGRVSDPRPPTALREHELLARLGLGPGASNDEVEAAHDQILEYLGRVPGTLRGWARVQITEADEAYARLNGAPASASAVEPLALPSNHVRADAIVRGAMDDDLEGFYDDADETQGPVVISRRSRRPSSARPSDRAQSAGRLRSQTPGGLVVPRATAKAIATVGAIVVLVVGAVGVYGLGSGGVPGLTGTPKPQATSGLDTAQVAALMEKIAANPKDTMSLMALANLYYNQGDYATAKTWLQKVLDVDPKNVDALLALGAAQFNSGDETSAKLAWEKVLGIDAKNIEAHYDLGFMYFSQNPPNVDKVREEWGAVIALAPDSDIAKTVQAHLASLGSPAPSSGSSGAPAGSPAAGSPAPASSGTPAASPAPSPAAS